MAVKIITGEKAKEELKKLLTDELYQKRLDTNFIGVGYYSEKLNGKEVFTAFDNTTHDCWVENFGDEENAIKYCNREEAKDINGIIVG